MSWDHPTETTMKKSLFRIPGIYQIFAGVGSSIHLEKTVYLDVQGT